MNLAVILWLSQDAIVNGAIYALLALALIVVYAVTRVICIPQGEFISFAALSLAVMQVGRVPGTIYLLVGAGLLIVALDGPRLARERDWSGLRRLILFNIGLPLVVAGLTVWAANSPGLIWLQMLATIGIVTPMGPMVYRLAF